MSFAGEPMEKRLPAASLEIYSGNRFCPLAKAAASHFVAAINRKPRLQERLQEPAYFHNIEAVCSRLYLWISRITVARGIPKVIMGTVVGSIKTVIAPMP